MQNQVEEVFISDILPNPYQPRRQEDPEHIIQLAHSIQQDGLLQFPVGRRVYGNVELAFGHSRLAAYHQLNVEDLDYSKLPVVLRELSDEQMCTYAITENINRKDLSPMEEALAMNRMREEFNKTSAQIGEIFGLSESAVRNKMRLLDLPEEVKEKIQEGNISESAGRKLLTLEKANPGAAGEISAKITENDLSPEALNKEIRKKLDNTHHVLCGRWDTAPSPPIGGAGLWPLSWTPEVIVPISWAAFKKACQKDNLLEDPQQEDFLDVQDRVVENWTEVKGEIQGLVTHLENLPPCTACEYHIAFDGTHYCGIKSCWARKKAAWCEAELERVSEALGIPSYDKELDGKIFEEQGDWRGANTVEYRAWVEEKAKHLRLKINHKEYGMHDITESYCVKVISIRDEAIKRIEDERLEKKQNGQGWKVQQDQYALQRENKARSIEFIRQAAAPLFSQVLTIGNLGFLISIAEECAEHKDDPKEGRIERITACKKSLMSRWLVNLTPYESLREGPFETASFLAGLAKAWGGVELPVGWLSKAADFVTLEGGGDG